MKALIELEIVNNEVVSAKVIKTEKKIQDVTSMYARFFDEGCPSWNKDPAYNKLFLKMHQDYANDLLKSRGHLFLNEVYDMLGIPRTREGACVGWIYDEANPVGDNFVDFDLLSTRNQRFINGETNVALLDFNVDGCILDHVNEKES